ncbi:hypothetical protein H0I76_07395 [Limibaculum sp. M0105]|uniref:Sulfotransferase family protein n=1 Tax=Thermohalobaculum xanthum TaxID=2753746 RepID=A0A8J7M7L2_9RHOB|nr:hypothetical protein [Thermohalobaculum xanthum]MBK0399009.1 hypothetical protein [Thermohalobaculum xanthum]
METRRRSQHEGAQLARKVFVHVGMMKTGTTAIQHMLSENREALLRNRLRFPIAPGYRAHLDLVLYAMNDERMGAHHRQKGLKDKEDLRRWRTIFEDHLARELGACDESIIFSDERLASLITKPEETLRLREFLSRLSDEIKIIIYIRDQISAIESFYSTEIRAGETHPLTPIKKERYFNRFEYNKIIERWADRFGSGSIILKEFSPESLLGGDVCRDFLSILGAQSDRNIDFPLNANESIGRNGIELLRHLNVHMGKGDSGIKDWRGGNIDQFIARIDRSEKIKLPADGCGEIIKWYKTDNEKIFQKYGVDLNSSLHKKIDARSRSEPTDEIRIDEIIDLFAKCWMAREEEIVTRECDDLVKSAHTFIAKGDDFQAIRQLERALMLGDPTGTAMKHLEELRARLSP